jgi:hypothetical protein
LERLLGQPSPDIPADEVAQFLRLLQLAPELLRLEFALRDFLAVGQGQGGLGLQIAQGGAPG